MNNFLKFLQKTLSDTNERIVLQRFYLIFSCFGFIIASFISLFESNLGRIILLLVVSSVSIYLINAVFWTLGQALKMNFIPEDIKNKNNPKK